MKNRNGWKLVVTLSAIVALAAACAAIRPGWSPSQVAAERKAALAYLANDNLSADIPQELARYTTLKPGSTQRLARATPTAPPLVPHDIAPLLPITIEENACLSCHLPDNAGKDDIPIPASHFQHPRVEVALLRANAEPHGSGMLSYVAGYSPGEELLGARYNCVQCHVPQSENVARPK